MCLRLTENMLIQSLPLRMVIIATLTFSYCLSAWPYGDTYVCQSSQYCITLIHHEEQSLVYEGSSAVIKPVGYIREEDCLRYVHWTTFGERAWRNRAQGLGPRRHQ